MKRGAALAEAADLFRRFHPWDTKAIDGLVALEDRRALKRPKRLERLTACQIAVRVRLAFGDTHRIEAQGETWEEAIGSLRTKLRYDRIAYGGGLPWLFAMLDAAADGTLDAGAAAQFRAWADREDGSV